MVSPNHSEDPRAFVDIGVPIENPVRPDIAPNGFTGLRLPQSPVIGTGSSPPCERLRFTALTRPRSWSRTGA